MSPRKIMLRIAFLLAALAFLLALLHRAGQIRRRHAEAPRANERDLPARLAEVTRGELVEAIDGLGIVRSRRAVSVAALVPGRIEDLAVREGERVRSGEVLLRLDGRERESQREALELDLSASRARHAAASARAIAARAAMERWRKDFGREERLAARGVVPGAQLDAARERSESAGAALEAAEREAGAAERAAEALEARLKTGKIQEGYVEVRAPMDAVVSARHREPGDVVGAGQPLLELLDERAMVLSCEFPETDLPRLAEGQEILAEGLPFPLRVDRILPRLTAKRMATVEADFANPGDAPLRAGQTLPLRLVVRRHADALLLPRAALARSGDGDVVHLAMRDGGFAVRPVRVLAYEASRVAVEADLSPGDRLLVGDWLGWLRAPAAGTPALATPSGGRP